MPALRRWLQSWLLATVWVRLATSQTGCVPGNIDIDFYSACSSGSPAHNNLGGEGPDNGAANIRYQGVGTKDGTRVDNGNASEGPRIHPHRIRPACYDH